MTIELHQDPAAAPLQFVLRCRVGGTLIGEVAYATKDRAEAARPEFARACREAFRS